MLESCCQRRTFVLGCGCAVALLVAVARVQSDFDGAAGNQGERMLSERPLVAVLEHTVRWGDTPAETIDLNLGVYEEYVMKAAQAGAKLIVTPEYGITGYPGSIRADFFPYSLDLPEVAQERHVPCDGSAEPTSFQRLSCMAKKHGLAIVASLIDFKDCSKSPSHAECHLSPDGYLLFNTDVVFDEDGAFIAKYHKANRWGEWPVDPSADCRAATLTPRALNITFGMFTCADLIYNWPALHLVSKGVRHFVMPLAWTNEMAQMQPLGWLQSWSLVANATLLAANARTPMEESGSGIFSRGEAISYGYDLSGSKDELVVAPLPLLEDDVAPPADLCPPEAPAFEPAHDGGAWRTLKLNMAVGAHSAELCSDGSGGVCCSLEYVSTHQGDGFVLAAFQGWDSTQGIKAWAAEACAVLPCADADGAAGCMKYQPEALKDGPRRFGAFSSLALRASGAHWQCRSSAAAPGASSRCSCTAGASTSSGLRTRASAGAARFRPPLKSDATHSTCGFSPERSSGRSSHREPRRSGNSAPTRSGWT
mmetsp:Transcript_163689/g.524941  ORF Transcript_163689/g.524941 Transcript_163689/m.524941 type:complete len:537 (+) Transcript_163689:66-1676(+)